MFMLHSMRFRLQGRSWSLKQSRAMIKVGRTERENSRHMTFARFAEAERQRRRITEASVNIASTVSMHHLQIIYCLLTRARRVAALRYFPSRLDCIGII